MSNQDLKDVESSCNLHLDDSSSQVHKHHDNNNNTNNNDAAPLRTLRALQPAILSLLLSFKLEDNDEIQECPNDDVLTHEQRSQVVQIMPQTRNSNIKMKTRGQVTKTQTSKISEPNNTRSKRQRRHQSNDNLSIEESKVIDLSAKIKRQRKANKEHQTQQMNSQKTSDFAQQTQLDAPERFGNSGFSDSPSIPLQTTEINESFIQDMINSIESQNLDIWITKLLLNDQTEKFDNFLVNNNKRLAKLKDKLCTRESHVSRVIKTESNSSDSDEA